MKTDSYSLKKLLIFISIIMIIIIIFYGLTTILTKNKKLSTDKKEIEETVIQYDEIVVGEIFSQKETEYYVLATFKNDSQLSNYNSIVSEYSEKKNSQKIYSINLNSGFNKKFVSSSSQFDGNYPIFKESTLLKISNKKILNVYEGQAKIKEQLNNLNSSIE